MSISYWICALFSVFLSYIRSFLPQEISCFFLTKCSSAHSIYVNYLSFAGHNYPSLFDPRRG